MRLDRVSRWNTQEDARQAARDSLRPPNPLRRSEYKTINRYEQLAFTWVSEHSMPGSLVTIDFKEKSPNETEVTLHHVGFPSEESRTNHEGGWGRILETLSTHLAMVL